MLNIYVLERQKSWLGDKNKGREKEEKAKKNEIDRKENKKKERTAWMLIGYENDNFKFK